MSWPDNYPESKNGTEERITNGTGPTEDIKHGFKLLGKNLLSYFLAIVGIVMLALLIMLAVVVTVGIFVVSTIGIWQAYEFLLWIVEVVTMAQGVSLVALVLFIATPLLGPLFVALGAIYGLSREVVESSTTRAGSAFSWYR
ncbi:hypothetical protein EU546_05220, partial [Candidatus Thorarchaeota archaeon]